MHWSDFLIFASVEIRWEILTNWWHLNFFHLVILKNVFVFELKFKAWRNSLFSRHWKRPLMKIKVANARYIGRSFFRHRNKKMSVENSIKPWTAIFNRELFSKTAIVKKLSRYSIYFRVDKLRASNSSNSFSLKIEKKIVLQHCKCFYFYRVATMLVYVITAAKGGGIF